MVSAFTQLFEAIQTKDGLWAALFVVLLGCMGYLYFGVIVDLQETVDRIEYNQIRDCVRNLGPKKDPAAVCMTPMPQSVINDVMGKIRSGQ